MKHILSLGAGVQSSTMALMAAKGEIVPMPDFAIFADTQAEPETVYKWLDWLELELPFPVYRISFGNLAADALEIKLSKKTGRLYLKGLIPLFTKGETNGILHRKCTSDYKIRPIQKFLRKYKSEGVIQWIGISTDEAHRQKSSRINWITNRYPLIEKNISRSDCLNWIDKNNYPTPPRSACYFCPYHSDAEWLRLKNEEPKEFHKAVVWERLAQDAAAKQQALKGYPYLHSSRVPLDQVVFSHERQANLFGNECEGMCGV